MTPENGRRQAWQYHTVLRCGSLVRAQVAMILAHESDATLRKRPRLSTREAARRADCRPESAQDAIAALRDLGAVLVVEVDGRKVATFQLVPAWWEHDRSGGPDQSTATNRSGGPDHSERMTDPVSRISRATATDPVDRIDPVGSSDRSGGPDQSDLATDPVSLRDRSGQPSRDLIFRSESSDSDPLNLSDLQIVARAPQQASDHARGPESISSTGESERQTPAPPEAEMPTTRREPEPSAPASQPTPIATATPSVTVPTRPAQPAPSVAVTFPPDDDPDLGPMISTVGAPLAERAVSLWGPTLAAELGARIHAVRADRQAHTRARSLVMRALDARLEDPPAELERILPPAGAPDYSPDEGAGARVIAMVTRATSAPARPGNGPSRPAAPPPAVQTAPWTANGAAPRPQDRRPVLERFAEQPEPVKARWLDDVDRVSGGALVGVAREAAAANRWDKAQSRPVPMAGRA